MWRMARRNALINRLSAVETLGATSVICTDKTGTLTENRLTVSRVILPTGTIRLTEQEIQDATQGTEASEISDPFDIRPLRELLEVGVLCNNASVQSTDSNEWKGIGDPLEVALLMAGNKMGIRRDELLKNMPEVREDAFDSDVKMMATFHEQDGSYRVAVKGAPESVLAVCSHIQTEAGTKEMSDEDRTAWLTHNSQMAGEGFRNLALAYKEVDNVNSNTYEGLTLLGLVGLEDPPRSDVRQAISACQEAGVRIVMVTGDQAETAQKVAIAVGLIDKDDGTRVIHAKELRNPDQLSEEDRSRLVLTPIFARVSPKQKLDLIDLHQGNHSVVAMTGDGVNDAPALKKADIGVAMGQRGTQVAREAADMVLKDDAFSTIVIAIEQGRVIFNNIRKFVVYLMSCNVSEIMAVSQPRH